MELLFCVLCSTSVLEQGFKGSGDSVPIKFISGEESGVVLVKGPYDPALDPIFDVFSLNEPQKKCCSFHGVINLVHTYIGQAVEVEFIHKGVGFATGPIKDPGGVRP